MAKYSTRDQIKIAAQRLFAERGIDGVSVREIVKAADQKNMASLHYYFHSKEELVRELLLDAAIAMESRRIQMLDAAEAKGGPTSAHQVLRIFIESAIIEDDDPRSKCNVSLFVLAFRENSSFIWKFVDTRKDTGYFRCLAHLKNFMADFDNQTINRRLYFLQQYVFNALAARERSLTYDTIHKPFWEKKKMVKELLITAEGLLFSSKF